MPSSFDSIVSDTISTHPVWRTMAAATAEG